MSEAGRMGGKKVAREYGPEFYSRIGQKGGQHSWTSGDPNAKMPQLTEQDRQRAQEIRQKLERGGDLTTEEAGFLGGVERVERASGRRRE